MKSRFDIFLLLALLLTAACTSTRPAATVETVEAEGGAVGEGSFVLLPAPDSLTPEQRATHYYLQGIRAAGIYRDSVRAAEAFRAALDNDSLHGPSLYELANLAFPGKPEQALAYSRRANRAEPDNLWFKQQSGQISIYTGHYEEARQLYGEILRLAPNDPNNVRYLAALYEETGEPERALALLDSAELRFGPIEELVDYKRHLLVNTGQYERAVEEAKAATRRSPYEPDYFIALGDLYAAAKRDSLALDAYRGALALDPEDSETLTTLSEFYLSRNEAAPFLEITRLIFESEAVPRERKLGYFGRMIASPVFYQRDSTALGTLADALRREYPDDGDVTRLYAQYQINSGHPDSALTAYKSALTDTAGMELYRTIIRMESYLERPDSAAHYTERALEHYPGEVDLYLTKGYGLAPMKAYEEAIATFAEALPHAANDSVRSVIYGSMGAAAEAADSTGRRPLRYYEQAVRLDPENLHAVIGYGTALIDRGKNPEKAFRRIGSDTLRSLALGTLGDFYYARDSVEGKKQAYELYEQALEYDPDNTTVLNNYAYFLSLDGRELEKALAMSARVLERVPGNATFIDTYGWILYKLGRPEEARASLRQAVALDTEASPELLIHYGDILYALKEYYMASVYWKKARDAGYDPARIGERLKKIGEE